MTGREMNDRISGDKAKIDSDSIRALYAKRAGSRASVDVDAPVVLASDTDPAHIREWNEREVAHWLPQLELDEKSRVLELGFGTGRIAKYIIEQAGQYAGIDYVDAFVDTVRNRKDIRVRYGIEPVFLQGSFQELVMGKISLPIRSFNRFVISGGVFMYINDEDLEQCIPKLTKLLDSDCIVYISEPIALTERLTLNRFYSDSIQSEYSAIYRTEKEYRELFAPFFEMGLEMKVSEEFFKEDIKGQKETRQWMFIMK